MESIESIALVYTDVLKNNPFTKDEQIDLFTKLAISNFENIQEIEFPCDEFYEWWVEVGEPNAINSYDKNINKENDEKELEYYLVSEEVQEWYKSTWIVDYVLEKIPH